MDRKAIFRPSGDQAGSKSSRRLVVRRSKPDPSAFTTQMSSVPFENVIRPVSVDRSIGDPVTAPAVGETAGVGTVEVRVGIATGTRGLPVHEARSARPPTTASAIGPWSLLMVAILSPSCVTYGMDVGEVPESCIQAWRYVPDRGAPQAVADTSCVADHSPTPVGLADRPPR